jgi:hypothetical protein
MTKKVPLLLVFALLLLSSLSCTNPITMYLSTQTAIMETATATMWTPTPTSTPTNTPTNTPTFTPTFTPTPEWLYFDDFEDEDSGWSIIENTSVLREYYDGGYRIMIKVAGIFGWSLIPDKEDYSDVRIEVDAYRLDGPDENDFGILCRYQDNNNFYAMEIGSAGYALIYKFEDGDYEGLSDDHFEDVDGIDPDDWNHIVAICSGESLELYVNGELVASAYDSSFSDGEVALVAGNGDESGADILFDNLYVYPA